ncbi:MAG: 23S rRNA (adenine(2503)-C(2))-methyltransferase RlmN [Endomicrobiales bacterium]|nr:23S rRNA (adenine(2503)-C(2))-methyltransferase RlmN [Endomicrobiales bacterium]
MQKKYLLDYEYKDLEKFISGIGLKPFRSRQIVKWVYQKRIESFMRCSDLPIDVREKLDSAFYLRAFKLHSRKKSIIDGTIRYNFLTRDNLHIPAVFLPQKGRNVACISSQAGCPVGCYFCQSGKTTLKRNLSKGEILEQIFQIEKDTGLKIDGVLFMGMGEPLLNYKNVTSAIKSILDHQQLGLGKKHVTISSIGIVPQINKLKEDQTGVRLAVSLHAPDDETRKKIVPEKMSYAVNSIMKAAISYSRTNKMRLTIEYMLISGLNETLLSAQKLVKLIRKHSNHKDNIQINLIPYNPTVNCSYKSPGEDEVEKFRNYLVKNKCLAIVRRAKGLDIGSACGQLGV